MHAFRLFWKERKCSPLLTSFCPLIPTKCILCFTHQHYPYVTCSQLLAHNQVLRQGGRKNVSKRFWSHKTQAHTSLCQEPFTQSQFFRRLGVLETQARSRPTSACCSRRTERSRACRPRSGRPRKDCSGHQSRRSRSCRRSMPVGNTTLSTVP